MTSQHADAIVEAASEGDHKKLARLIADARTVKRDLNHMHQTGVTALGTAAFNGHERCVRILLDDPRLTKDTLDARALKRPDGGGGTALTAAAENGHMQCVQMILHDARATEATVNAKGGGDAPAIVHAAQSGSERTLDLLLTDPRTTAATVNSRSDKGTTALGIACALGHERCVEMLLADKRTTAATVNSRSDSGGTALGAACLQGHERCVEMLLADKRTTADTIEARDVNGASALQAACEAASEVCIAKLLQHGADPNGANMETGITPLAMASYSGEDGCVELLLKTQGININTTDKHGNTALDFATGCASYWPEVQADVECETLLKRAGAQSGRSQAVASSSAEAAPKRQKRDGGRRLRRKDHHHLEQELRALFGGAIPSQIRAALQQREQVEHRQELACVSYLEFVHKGGTTTCTRQKTLQAGDIRVRADVYLQRRGKQDQPWEVKDCDDIHKLQSAHGQADFQRLLAGEDSASGLYLFTHDGKTGQGRRNFDAFVQTVLPKSRDRYSRVVLAHAVAAEAVVDDAVKFDKANVIAVWNRKDAGDTVTKGVKYNSNAYS